MTQMRSLKGYPPFLILKSASNALKIKIMQPIQM